MRQLLSLLLVFMLSQISYGLNIDHVTFNRQPYRIEYTGITGAIIDEYESLLTKEWYRELRYRYEVGVYDEIKLSSKLKQSSRLFAAARASSWWDRPWWNSLESSPRRKVITAGPRGDIMDLGVARITNKWKLKLKEYETAIAANYHESSGLVTGWKFKFSPTLNLSMRDLIRRAAFRLRFTWFRLGLKIVQIDINAGYKVIKNEMFIEIIASLVQW